MEGEERMNELLSNLLVAVIIAAITIIIRVAVPMIKQMAEGTKMEIALRYAEEFVRAAEQTMTKVTGKDRKAWVTMMLKGLLTAKNISLTDAQIDALIESAVFNMNLIIKE